MFLDEKKSSKVYARIADNTKERIQELAKVCKMTVSKIVNEAIKIGISAIEDAIEDAKKKGPKLN